MTTVKIHGGGLMREAIIAARPQAVRAFRRAVEESFLLPVVHGKTCKKVAHDPRQWYLHNSQDNSAFDVDGVEYCGRCHIALVPSVLK
jgi:hypothetical protein